METAAVMESSKNTNLGFLFMVSGGVILLDQLTKIVVQNLFFLGQSIAVIPGFFNLTYVRNPGAAFGFLASGNPAFVIPFFILISIVVVAGIVYYYRKSDPTQRLHRWGLALILGGAIGNLIDRVVYQSVVDFLDFYRGHYHWPAFNVADSAITIGVGLIILDMLLTKGAEKTS
jgi:signal peptidase II